MSLSVIASDKQLSQAVCQSVFAVTVGMACCEVSDIEEMSNLFMAVEKFRVLVFSCNKSQKERKVIDCVLLLLLRRDIGSQRNSSNEPFQWNINKNIVNKKQNYGNSAVDSKNCIKNYTLKSSYIIYLYF